MLIATFDIGTTAIKGVLVNHEKEIVFQRMLPIDTLYHEDYKEQNPCHWYQIFCLITQQMWQAGFLPKDISAIIMSGQMQDFIPVNAKGEAIRPAILYSDARATQEAIWINRQIDKDTFSNITGNAVDGSIPVSKWLWYRTHEAEHYANTANILVSAKDYIIAQLTQCFVTDYTSAATFGLMDITQKQWSNELLQKLAIDPARLPKLLACHQQAGVVQGNAIEASGFYMGTPVYAGSGDAGASTLASGITTTGEYSIYLGTTGWIATISNTVLIREGVFNLAAIPENTYINVVPFLNAGNVHQWITQLLQRDLTSENYQIINDLLDHSRPGSNGLLFLPYLMGERFPIMDTEAKGAFIGLTQQTSRADMVRACLEGIAFSIRMGLETICAQSPTKITLVGGGTNVPVWRQILADVLNREVIVLHDATYLPSIALVSSVLIDQQIETDYSHFIQLLLNSEGVTCYSPDTTAVSIMEQGYMRYQKIYPCIKGIN